MNEENKYRKMIADVSVYINNICHFQFIFFLQIQFKKKTGSKLNEVNIFLHIFNISLLLYADR